MKQREKLKKMSMKLKKNDDENDDKSAKRVKIDKKLKKIYSDDEIEIFKSTKRLYIDDYFKKIINVIDIKLFELTSTLETSGENVDSKEYKMGILKKYGQLLIDEIEKLRIYTLEQFELNTDEIISKYKEGKMHADSDEMNSLIFKKFCFLYDVDENDVDEIDQKTKNKESDELVKMLKFMLVVSDWYLNENQLGRLK